MSFLDDFGTENKYTATFESYTETIVENVITAETWTAITTTPMCLLWDTTTAKMTVSEKYKQVVEAIAVFNYSDITFTIPKSGRVTINGKLYSILVAENIAEQNEVIQVLLKMYDA